jgi:hypothetical protein
MTACPAASAILAVPFTVHETAYGTARYSVEYSYSPHGNSCMQYYEVSNGTITSAWHTGRNCVITH